MPCWPDTIQRRGVFCRHVSPVKLSLWPQVPQQQVSAVGNRQASQTFLWGVSCLLLLFLFNLCHFLPVTCLLLSRLVSLFSLSFLLFLIWLFLQLPSIAVILLSPPPCIPWFSWVLFIPPFIVLLLLFYCLLFINFFGDFSPLTYSASIWGARDLTSSLYKEEV